jgi:hypothetical protein
MVGRLRLAFIDSHRDLIERGEFIVAQVVAHERHIEPGGSPCLDRTLSYDRAVACLQRENLAGGRVASSAK